jgi:hypothetical protein
MVWNTLKPFLNDRIKSKVSFIDSLTQENIEAAGLYLRSIPREWGGGEDAFSIKEG